jgi:hypothetical protein
VAGNALYCPKNDQILLDVSGFTRQLLREHGPLAVTMILAHEYGHAIQQRADAELPAVHAELQADCFAGAFATSAVPDNEDPSTVLAQPLLALSALADPAGSNPGRRAAHGSGFDRVAAFLGGLDHGVRYCGRYPKNAPDVTSFKWRGRDDEASGGDFDPGSLVRPFSNDLNAHYQVVASKLDRQWVAPASLTSGDDAAMCADAAPHLGAVAWCGNGAVTISNTELANVARIGDVAAAAELGRAWAWGAQRQFPAALNADSETTECLTGVWLGTMHPRADGGRRGRISLSPPDLDEVVEAVLVDELHGDRLARLRALLSGFYVGLRECVNPNAVG